jgi:hypothetical protein
MPFTVDSQPSDDPFFSGWMFGLSSARFPTVMSPVATTFSSGR